MVPYANSPEWGRRMGKGDSLDFFTKDVCPKCLELIRSDSKRYNWSDTIGTTGGEPDNDVTLFIKLSGERY
jgi:hypothetical protein